LDDASKRSPHGTLPGQEIRSVSLFFRVPLSEIGYVRAVVEGHDGLALMRSLAANSSEIEWLVPEPLLEDALRLARALEIETGMRQIGGPTEPSAPG